MLSKRLNLLTPHIFQVTEIRGIARSNVVIGNLEFDTSDFYQAEPQNLTIDVNENGTIKLNVIATWR